MIATQSRWNCLRWRLRHHRQWLTYSKISSHLSVSRKRLQLTTGHISSILWVQERMSVERYRHKPIPPYHTESNGTAESSVGLLKQALMKDVLEVTYGRVHTSLQHRLASCSSTEKLRIEEHQQSFSWNIKRGHCSTCCSQIWAETSKLNRRNRSYSTT